MDWQLEMQTKDNPKSLTSTEGEIAFRFIYGTVQLQCVEQRTHDYGCAFCPMKCHDLLGLRYHLAASHDIFTYELETGTLTVIWVRRRMEVFDEGGEIFCPTTRELMFSLKKVRNSSQLSILSSTCCTGALHEQSGLSASEACAEETQIQLLFIATRDAVGRC